MSKTGAFLNKEPSMKMVAVGRPQTLMLFPKPKLLRDSYLNIKKGGMPFGLGDGVALIVIHQS